jgi:cold shock CspA family protein
MSEVSTQTDNQASGNEREFVDYNTLPLIKAKVKFYDEKKKFGFVSLLNENDEPYKDAFISGRVLEKAQYESVKADDIIQVKHFPREKGEAVVYVKRQKNNFVSSYDNPSKAPAESQSA